MYALADTRTPMTLNNGLTAPVDFEGAKGTVSAVFADEAATGTKIGDVVTVDGAELKVTELAKARAGHTAVVAAPATFTPRAITLE